MLNNAAEQEKLSLKIKQLMAQIHVHCQKCAILRDVSGLERIKDVAVEAGKWAEVRDIDLARVPFQRPATGIKETF